MCMCVCGTAVYVCMSVLDSILGKFADDTRVQRNISQASDCDILQKDLDNIITWSKHNNMELHEDKFELLSYNTYKTEKNSQRSNLLKAFAELPFNLPPKYQTPNNSIIKAKSLVKSSEILESSSHLTTPGLPTSTSWWTLPEELPPGSLVSSQIEVLKP